MAAAVVSGAAALVLSSQPKLAPLGVRMLLQLGAQDLKTGLLVAGAGSWNIAASVARGKGATVIAGETIASSDRAFTAMVFGDPIRVFRDSREYLYRRGTAL